MSALLNTLRRLGSSFYSGLKFYSAFAGILLYDLVLLVFNALTPKMRKGTITSCGGNWPKYSPPQDGDSRSACPGLNALANHGILPRSGRGISFVELNHVVRANFNFAPTFSWYVANFIANVLDRNYATDTCDLEDISSHNGIEHDASLTRLDTYLAADQSKPCKELVEEVISAGTGPNGTLTIKDISNLLAKRRVESRKANGQYSQSFNHKIFGSSNSSTLLTHFGGDPDAIRSFLLEERLPDGWEPTVRDRMGLTMIKINATAFPVEMNIDERSVRVEN